MDIKRFDTYRGVCVDTIGTKGLWLLIQNTYANQKKIQPPTNYTSR